jgi:hypothetical protein
MVDHFEPGETDPLELADAFTFDLPAPAGQTIAADHFVDRIGRVEIFGGLRFVVLAADVAGDGSTARIRVRRAGPADE